MAGESTLSKTYTDLATTTFENVANSGKLWDIVFENNVILNKFRELGMTREIAGGERLSGGVMDKKPTTRSYTGTEELPVTIANIGTRWFLSPKLYATPVGISGDDMTSNRGPEAFVNMLTERIENGALESADAVAGDIAEDDGTGNSGKNITGFPAMMPSDPTTGTYAQINSATNTKWRSTSKTSVGSVATAGVASLRTLYNDIGKTGTREGSMFPDIAFTEQAIHEAYEALLLPRMRIQDGGATVMDGNLGNGRVFYKGMEIVWAPQITTTGVLFAMASAAVDLTIYRDRNFEMDDVGLQKPVNQDARIGQIFFKGNLVTYGRNKTGSQRGLS